ncbi:NAD(P)/FAD-dependent oxidoreductase [Microvirga rosea]|uniref:NAD(P)/FAD-dependent oxidoreductase n=1 Tax=Microvirga rosea TaxID=2715425 RepID=UPI001D0B7474|nr:FAD-dependent oxidoreductase [Microvirga rosea]MCB8821239.1 FAD-binding oxidoreductase [Microvirga rosea]
MTGFPITLATPPAFTGPLPEAVDIAVIGGGIIGLMGAWALAAEGKRVLLCEKGRLAGEQSGRNWGWIRQQGRDIAELPIMVEAIRLWADLPNALRAAIGFRQQGITYFARTEARLEAFDHWLDLAKPFGVDTRLLSRRETEALLPNAAGWVGALHTPSDAMAEPFVTVPVLARAAEEAGVIIREGCAVRGLETSAGHLSAIVTEAGTVRCTQAILAGGAWSALFLRAHGLTLPQLSVLSSVSATTAMPDFFQGAACDDRFAIRRRADGGYTLTPWSFHEFFIGPDAFRNLRAFLPQIRADLSSTHFRPAAPKDYPDAWGTPRRWSRTDESPFERCRILNPRPNAAELARLKSHFEAAFPAIGTPTIASTWAGMIDVLPDALPVVDHTPLPGLILATGMSGHGFGIAPGMGKAMADLALGRTPRQDLTAFRYGRFSERKGVARSTAL